MKFLAKTLLLAGLIVAGKLIKQQPPEATISVASGALTIEATPTPASSFFTRQLYPRSGTQSWRITPVYFTASASATTYE